MCQHGRQRNQCKEHPCKGASICQHGRLRNQCKEHPCKGSSICQHGRQRTQCKEHPCKGSSICQHNRLRHHCTEGPCGFIPSSRKCQACCSKLVNPTPGVPATYLCATCRDDYGVSNLKKWEAQTESWLDEAGLPWSYSNKKLPCAPTTRYPDYMFVGADHCVLLEVDEDAHARYNLQCEIRRISEIMDSIDSKSLHVIRYNPNAKGDTATRKTALIQAIRDALETNFGAMHETGCAVQYLGYSRDRIVALESLSCAMHTGSSC